MRILLLPWIFFISFSAIAAEISGKLDVQSAKKFMELAHIKYDSYSKPDPSLSKGAFIIFQVLGDDVGTTGWYSVNQWTGDVWDSWNCKKVLNLELQQKQEEIKKSFNGNQKTYEHLHTLRPYNPATLEQC